MSGRSAGRRVSASGEAARSASSLSGSAPVFGGTSAERRGSTDADLPPDEHDTIIATMAATNKPMTQRRPTPVVSQTVAGRPCQEDGLGRKADLR